MTEVYSHQEAVNAMDDGRRLLKEVQKLRAEVKALSIYKTIVIEAVGHEGVKLAYELRQMADAQDREHQEED